MAFVLIGAFTALNVHDAATIPIWYDEGWTLMEITGGLTREGIQIPVGTTLDSDQLLALVDGPGTFAEVAGSLYVHDTHPPVYFQTLWAWTHLFGTSALGMRSLSVACMVAASLVVYTYTRRLAGPMALLALTLFFTSPGGAYSAVNARGYGVALLLVSLAMVGLLRVVDDDKPKRWALVVGAAAGIGAITHYFTILTLLPAGLAALVFLIARRRWVPLGLMVLTALPGLASAALVWLPQQIHARPNQNKDFGDLAVEGISMFRVFTNQFTQLTVFPLWVGIPTVILGAMLLAAMLVQGRRNVTNPFVAIPFAGFFGSMAGMFLLFWATDKTLLSFSIPRYGVLALPSIAILLAQLTPNPWRDKPSWVAGGVVALILAGLIPRIDPTGFDNPWASAQAARNGYTALATMAPRSVVVITTKETGRIGTTLHTLPPNIPVVYLPTAKDFAAWIVDGDAYDVLHMRPLFWANKPGARPFPDGFYKAAEAAGFVTEGMAWTREHPIEAQR